MLDEFVADPHRPDMTPPHNTGGSIDLTLFEVTTGNTLDMGSHFDESSKQSYTVALENSPNHPAHQLRRLLYNTMLKAGFSNLPSEWWHYDYGNQNWAFFKKMSHAYFGKIQLNH